MIVVHIVQAGAIPKQIALKEYIQNINLQTKKAFLSLLCYRVPVYKIEWFYLTRDTENNN